MPLSGGRGFVRGVSRHGHGCDLAQLLLSGMQFVSFEGEVPAVDVAVDDVERESTKADLNNANVAKDKHRFTGIIIQANALSLIVWA